MAEDKFEQAVIQKLVSEGYKTDFDKVTKNFNNEEEWLVGYNIKTL